MASKNMILIIFLGLIDTAMYSVSMYQYFIFYSFLQSNDTTNRFGWKLSGKF